MRLRSAGVLLVCALALIIGVLPAEAQFQTRAKFAFLMDLDTGAVLFQKNADELMSPASMSKLMTIAVVFKALKDGQLRPDDEFLMSEHAWRTGGAPSGAAAMFVTLNSREKLSELLQGLIVQSGNDAAIAIAEGMAGSEQAFAQLMIAYARRIGLTKSTFGNPTGLPHPDQLMTARELALLAAHVIQEYPDYYRYFSQRRYDYKRYKFVNRNPLLYLDIGVDGLKTGFIKESGYGLVASGVQDGRRLILVVNGLKTMQERKEEAQRLYEWGIKGFKEFRLFEQGEVVSEARVWGGDRFYVPLIGNGGVRVLLPRFSNSRSKLRARVVYTGPIKPPVRRGDQIAVLRVSASKDAESEVPLYAAEDVEQGSIFRRGFDSLLHLAFGWIL
ncbi:MAG: D-alanyl-D-alanine carboxypeptidase [Rhizobiales bacterium]|nr:D-alanyl-D-alanine carboxypeptidase [Hyphomicrobiales bacterium]